MQIVIEGTDFPRLSPETQKELLQYLAAKPQAGAGTAGKPQAARTGASDRGRFHWRRPIDLDHDLTVKLMHGLGDDHRRRLHVFAENGGRASMRSLLEVTGDSDWHVLSYFQSVVTRKLRRLLNDREKIVHLIGWDYDSAVWNEDHTVLVDGVYYVTDPSAAALQGYFHLS